MSAALQFPALALAAAAQRHAAINRNSGSHGHAAVAEPQPTNASVPDSEPASPLRGFGPHPERFTDLPQPGLHPAIHTEAPQPANPQPELCSASAGQPVRPPNLAFYRKHTETLLRRYLYASMLVGRAPSMLKEPLMRGFASCRPVVSFEDSVIFVLDMESAVARLSAVDRLLLNKIVLQEYTIAETALLLNKQHRTICHRLAEALDQLTWILLRNGTLKVPRPHKSAAEKCLRE